MPAALKPATAPVPPTVNPVKRQRVAVAARTAKGGAVEVDEGDVAVDFLLPGLGDKMLVLPESEEDLGVQTDEVAFFEAFQPLFAFDVVLSFVEAGGQLNLGEIQFSEGEGLFVLLLVTREAIAVGGAFPDAPTLAQKLGGVEGGGAVDRDDIGLSRDDMAAVCQKSSELGTRTDWVINDSLGHIGWHLQPVGVVHENRHQLETLFAADLFHG